MIDRLSILEAWWKKLGSGKSGHWGHAGGRGGKGHPGGSVPRSVAMSVSSGPTAQKRQEFQGTGIIVRTGNDGKRNFNYYEIPAGTQLPESIKDADKAVILIPQKSGPLLVTDNPRVMHATLAAAEGLYGKEFDSFTRPWLVKGKLLFSSQEAGVDLRKGRSNAEKDRMAERSIARAARTLAKMGMSRDTPLQWETVDWKKLQLTLGDFL